MLYLFSILISAIAVETCHKHDHTHSHQQEHNHHFAVAILHPDNDSGVSGVVKFVQIGDKTIIKAKITGLSDGLHGFHIHEFGNLLKGCITAGAHYNPHGLVHGGPSDETRHVGDLGNVESKGNEAYFTLEDHLIKLTGEFSVIGRSVVVHGQEDDLGKTEHPDSLTTGNAGSRLACGVIGISGPFEFDF